jgi:hypothetical protein
VSTPSIPDPAPDLLAAHKAAGLLLQAARVDPILRAAAETVQDALIAAEAELDRRGERITAALALADELDIPAVRRALTEETPDHG